MRGQPDAALRIAEGIGHLEQPAKRAELEMRRALAYQQLGQIDRAISSYSAALPDVRNSGDKAVEARLLSNRGIAYAYQGDSTRAIEDALAAEGLATELGQSFLAGCAAHNAGFALGRAGDVVRALQAFDRADDNYALVNYPGRCDGVLAADRCEVLLMAGLNAEAVTSAELAVAALEDVADVNDLSEARLLLARACLATDRFERAIASAETARTEFVSADRAGWAALAEHLVLLATLMIGESTEGVDAASLDRVDQIARDLDESGWPAEAIAVHVSAAELAVRAGDAQLAAEHLGRATTARHRGRADRRATAWLATGMLRRLEGNSRGAQSAVDAGLRAIFDHQSTLAATELRAGASAHAQQLADLAMTLAVESGRPRRILRAAERVRANAIGRVAVAGDGRDLAPERRTLRRLEGELVGATDDPHRQAELRIEIARSENSIRNLARQSTGSIDEVSRWDHETLFAALGDGDLIEFIEHKGRIGAVNVSNRVCRFVDLADVDEVNRIIETAHFSLTRTARSGASNASIDAASASLIDAGRHLDRLLIEPLRLRADRLVLVPTGVLHSVPWSLLPSVRDRPFSVAPSAQRWSSVTRRATPTDEVRIVVGRNLRHGHHERDLVAACYSSSRHLSGSDATVDAVLGLLDGAGIAHVACHGSFRSESPMFSALQLEAASLNLYDLEDLPTPPQLVVLPACDAAASKRLVGDELLGTASALLGIGVQAVVAPLNVISDRASPMVMSALHADLAGGASAPHALAAARRAADHSGDPAAVAAAGAFIVLE